MNVYDRIKKQAAKYDMTLQQLAKEAGLGTNSIYRWREMNPKMDSLTAVAEVLHVSVDYLLGNTDNPSQPKKVGNHREVDLADDTLILSFDGKEVSPEDRELILRLMRGKKDGR